MNEMIERMEARIYVCGENAKALCTDDNEGKTQILFDV